MKPTLELQEIVSALGIDPFRFLAWQEKELEFAEKKMKPYIEESSDSITMDSIVV